MRDIARRTGISQRTAGFSIMLLGVLFATVHVWHYFAHAKPILADVFGVIIPVGLSLAIIYAGYWTLNRPDRFGWFFRLWIWTYAGSLGMALIAGLIVLHQVFSGALVEDAPFILAIAASGGAIGGFAIGVYEAQNWRRRKRIEAIHGATRSLMNAQTVTDVSELAVDIAEEALDMPLICVWLYTDNRLEPAAITERGLEEIGDPPKYTPGDSLSWKAFEEGETRVVADLSEETDAYNSESLARSELIVPLGELGVMNIGSRKLNAFDEIDIATAKILALTTAAALERAKREEVLRTQREELQRQTDQLDNFARTLSHDLRNPLSVAIGRIELAKRTGDQNHLLDATDALDQMSTFIDDLLTLALQGKQIGELEPVAFQSCVDVAWNYVDTKDATLECETDVTICGDPDRLQQLFENLFRNAIEHGGPAVTVTVGVTDDVMYIEDTGQGIDLDDPERVFDTGFSTGEEGTGYGLSIVQEIVNAHGWEISVVKATSGGVRFEIHGVEKVDEDCCVATEPVEST